MLLLIVISLAIITVASEDIKDTKLVIVFPVPLDMPNRNDRSEQCWLRVEEVDLTETLAVKCHISQDFLKKYLSDYNTKKLAIDGVELLTWPEIPKSSLDDVPASTYQNQKIVKDWRVTTYTDPITYAKVYVSTKADCRLLMYSREGMTNYKVPCDQILYFINTRNGVAAFREQFVCLLISALILFVPKFLTKCG